MVSVDQLDWVSAAPRPYDPRMARSDFAARRSGVLETEVLACLAAAGKPQTASDVLSDLGDSLAYTTVMTTLARLHRKGAIAREQAGRAYAYFLPHGPEAVAPMIAAHKMLRLLGNGEDRAGVLARFVADLSPEDARLLSDLLAGTADPTTGS